MLLILKRNLYGALWPRVCDIFVVTEPHQQEEEEEEEDRLSPAGGCSCSLSVDKYILQFKTNTFCNLKQIPMHNRRRRRRVDFVLQAAAPAVCLEDKTIAI